MHELIYGLLSVFSGSETPKTTGRVYVSELRRAEVNDWCLLSASLLAGELAADL